MTAQAGSGDRLWWTAAGAAAFACFSLAFVPAQHGVQQVPADVLGALVGLSMTAALRASGRIGAEAGARAGPP